MTTPATETMLEIMVNAAAAGHDLTSFKVVEGGNPPGFDAHCRLCGQSVWVGLDGLQYSLLDDQCPGEG